MVRRHSRFLWIFLFSISFGMTHLKEDYTYPKALDSVSNGTNRSQIQKVNLVDNSVDLGHDTFFNQPILLIIGERRFQGLPDYSWVEVTRYCCEWWPLNKGRPGYWLHLVIGSGIFYNIGRSIQFPTHHEACFYFLLGNSSYQKPMGNCTVGGDFPEMNVYLREEAERRGYDSIHFFEHGLNIEIMDVHDKGFQELNGVQGNEICSTEKQKISVRVESFETV